MQATYSRRANVRRAVFFVLFSVGIDDARHQRMRTTSAAVSAVDKRLPRTSARMRRASIRAALLDALQ